MYFNKAFFSLVAFTVASVAAAPAEISKRQDGTVTACTDPVLEGACDILGVDFGTCYNFSAQVNNRVESVAITTNMFCNLYKNDGCGGDLITVSANPSNQNPFLQTLPPGWIDVLSSVRCFRR